MELSAVVALAYRDLMKLIRDPIRLVTSLIFPVIFIGILGGSFQSGFGSMIDYDFMHFVFVGVLAQTLFQSSALGIISLIEDRQNDFIQEVFVSPISRYTIVIGKIIGESLVSLIQGIAILGFGVVIGIPFNISIVLSLVVVSVIVCVFGGSFGILVLSNLKSQRIANQIFPFIMLPQIFLSGVFTPIGDLPIVLDVLSRLSPMRYAVDLARGIYYAGKTEYDSVVLVDPTVNLVIIFGLFSTFVILGTWLFVRNERK
ncbi:MAG: ABC transporter permease [Anaerolineales bacterium]